MLLIVALPDDPLGVEILIAARQEKRHVAIISDFSEISWELHIDDRGCPTTTLTFGDTATQVDSIIYLGASWSRDDGDFCANERIAAWWALLAAFPGPVVNRPSRHGLAFTLDRARTRSKTDCRPFRWVLREAWRTRKHSLIRVAEDLHSIGTAPSGKNFAASNVVLEITECTPSEVQRFVLAGNRLTPIEPNHETSADFVSFVHSQLLSDLPSFALIVAEKTPTGGCAVLDISSKPPIGTLGAALSTTIQGILEATN